MWFVCYMQLSKLFYYANYSRFILVHLKQLNAFFGRDMNCFWTRYACKHWAMRTYLIFFIEFLDNRRVNNIEFRTHPKFWGETFKSNKLYQLNFVFFLLIMMLLPSFLIDHDLLPFSFLYQHNHRLIFAHFFHKS